MAPIIICIYVNTFIIGNYVFFLFGLSIHSFIYLFSFIHPYFIHKISLLYCYNFWCVHAYNLVWYVLVDFSSLFHSIVDFNKTEFFSLLLFDNRIFVLSMKAILPEIFSLFLPLFQFVLRNHYVVYLLRSWFLLNVKLT